MKAMIIGGGGREHALAWQLAGEVDELYVAPGNAGTETCAENVPIEASDISKLTRFALQNSIDLTVVGPDDTLAHGLVDVFESQGLPVFGPTKAAAQIESSKAFAKEMMRKEGIPTAEYRVFDSSSDALTYIEGASYPLMVKASGLALGKGVIRCDTPEAAEQAVRDMLVEKGFGAAGELIVIESFIEGTEASMHAFCDGKTYDLFPLAQDHKTIRENSQGPMTGGMGTVAPLPWYGPAQMKLLGNHIVQPSLNNMRRNGTPFKGMLFPGIIMNDRGPHVLEYNARFGDPETQVYMRLLESSLLKTVMACVDGDLKNAKSEWSRKSAVCVVLASKGYPATSTKGVPIEGIDEAEKQPGIVVFHAGTKRENGQVVTNGGRVLGVTAMGDSITEARSRAYGVIDTHINFDGMQFRRDIGEIAALEEVIKKR